jgi:hypothetical protein
MLNIETPILLSFVDIIIKNRAGMYGSCQLFNFTITSTDQCNPSWWVAEGNLQCTKCLFHDVSWICNRNPAVLVYPVAQLWICNDNANFILFIEHRITESCRLNILTEGWGLIFCIPTSMLWRTLAQISSWRNVNMTKVFVVYLVAPDKFWTELHPRGLKLSSALLWEP